MNKKTSKALWLLAFIPLAAALILFWSFQQATPVTSALLSSEVLGEKEFTDPEQCEMFNAMISEADLIEAPINPLESYHSFKLTLKNMTGETDYDLYLSGNAADSQRFPIRRGRLPAVPEQVAVQHEKRGDWEDAQQDILQHRFIHQQGQPCAQ